MSRFTLFVVLLAVVSAVLLLSPAAAESGKVGYPNSMASTGDSITRAFNTCTFPFTDCVKNSWSTGTSSTVKSHYYRILQANSGIKNKNYNDAKTGAQMVDLNSQVSTVNGRGVEYVTILMGANDVCTSSESSMTSVDTFRSQFAQAMATLSAGSPNARIYAVSVPDVYHLWEILKDNSSARLAWDTYDICQSLLENPLSTAQEDVDRRLRVRQRNIDFNTVLAEVCAQYIHCRFDNNTVFNYPFKTTDVSTRDYFHPSVAGQTTLASATYAVTFDFTDMTAPTSSSSTTTVSGGIEVTLGATDNVGVAGIEYRIDSGGWQRYTGPVTVGSGHTITWRAVDVNGNYEATQTITA